MCLLALEDGLSSRWDRDRTYQLSQWPCVLLGGSLVCTSTVSTLTNSSDIRDLKHRLSWHVSLDWGLFLLTMQVLLSVGKLSQVSGGVPLNIVLVIEGNGVKVSAWLFLSYDAGTRGQREAV